MLHPQLLVVGLVQGAMFLLIFRYVFGGAINTVAPIPYVDFLVPGYIVTGVLFAGMAASAGVAEDLEQGFIDRLRSLPISRFSVIAGRAIGDTILLATTLVVTIAVGFAVGFRIHTNVGQALFAYVLCVVFGFAFDWLFIYLGLVAGNAQAAQSMSLLVFPFTFVSSAFVPVDTMPSWLQPIADHQPITYMVDSVRALTVGAQPGQSTAGSIAGLHLVGGADRRLRPHRGGPLPQGLTAADAAADVGPRGLVGGTRRGQPAGPVALEGGDVVGVAQREADVVEALEEALRVSSSSGNGDLEPGAGAASARRSTSTVISSVGSASTAARSCRATVGRRPAPAPGRSWCSCCGRCRRSGARSRPRSRSP